MKDAALVLATRNAHKVQEIRQVLGDDFQYLTIKDFSAAPVVVEDGETFAANAGKKAASLAHWLAGHSASVLPKLKSPDIFLYVVADDSGLEVDALEGAPGVHSARFAALDVGGIVNAPDSANNAKLLHLLENVPLGKRAARFRCVLAVCKMSYATLARKFVTLPAGQPLLLDGVCEGSITDRPAGAGGFGYDPLFIPNGQSRSFAELGDAVKNSLSHRALALASLRDYLVKPKLV
jgi:XTP/dITP diphosphohydrolase